MLRNSILLLVAASLLATTNAQAQARFAAPVAYPFNAQGIHAVTYDLNRDGALDFVIAGGAANAAVVLLSTATGYAAPAYYPTAGFCGGVGLGTFNCDAYADLWAADYDAGAVLVRPGQAGGAFGAVQVSAPAGGQVQHVATADLNGDGRTDFAALNILAGTLGVGLATGPACTAAFAPPVAYGTASGPLSAQFTQLVDLNGDRYPDAVVVNQATPGRGVSVLLGTAAGTFGAATAYPTGAGYPLDLTLADLDGDGRLDAVMAFADDNNLVVLPGGAAPLLGAPVRYPLPGPAQAAAVADFDGDGRPDVAAVLRTGALVLLPGRAGGTLGPAGALGTLAVPAAQCQLLADNFAGDAKPDLALVSAGQLVVLRNLGPALATAPAAPAVPAVPYPNPTGGTFQLDGADPARPVRAFDALGRAVAVTRFAGRVQLAQPQPGWYRVEWTAGDGRLRRASVLVR